MCVLGRARRQVQCRPCLSHSLSYVRRLSEADSASEILKGDELSSCLSLFSPFSRSFRYFVTMLPNFFFIREIESVTEQLMMILLARVA